MKNLKRASCALLCALLAACGGGGEPVQDIPHSAGPWRCIDFVYQQDAQQWFDLHGHYPQLGAEYVLDSKGDGVVDCPGLLPGTPKPAGQ